MRSKLFGYFTGYITKYFTVFIILIVLSLVSYITYRISSLKTEVEESKTDKVKEEAVNEVLKQINSTTAERYLKKIKDSYENETSHNDNVDYNGKWMFD